MTRGDSAQFPCMDCGSKAYSPSWSAPNDLWNRIVGDPNGFLCPNCFTLRGDAILDVPIWDVSVRDAMTLVDPRDPIVVTDGDGWGWLRHGRAQKPGPVRIWPSDENRAPVSIVLYEIDAEEVRFRVFREDGEPLRHDAVAVRLNVAP